MRARSEAWRDGRRGAGRPASAGLGLAVRALSLALLLAAGAGCAERQQAPEAAVPERIPEQEIIGYKLIQTEAGVRRWVLTSDRMRKYPGDNVVDLESPRMEFYRDGVYYSTLTARQGKANLVAKDLDAAGDVVVVTVDGRRLETEELHYDNASGHITNTVFNRFTRDGDVATGYGLVATPALDYFEIRERVDAAVKDQPASAKDAP